MKKLSAAVAIVLAGALAALADANFLYWRTTEGNVTSLFDGSVIDYDYAKVWYGTYNYYDHQKLEGDYLMLYSGTPYGESTAIASQVDRADASSAAYWGLSDASAFAVNDNSYFVYELYDDIGNELGFLARAYGWDAAALASSSSSEGAAGEYVLTGVIPEPSSALLSLIGLGLLALRRKQTIGA